MEYICAPQSTVNAVVDFQLSYMLDILD